MAYCPNCGTRVSDDSIFCTECGTKLQQTEASVSQPESAPEPEPAPHSSPVPPPPPMYHPQSGVGSALKIIIPIALGVFLIGAIVVGAVWFFMSHRSDKALTSQPEDDTEEVVTHNFSSDVVLHHHLTGVFIDDDGRYPVELDFTTSDGNVVDVVYKNVTYGGKIRMTCTEFTDETMRFKGKDGNNDFTITLHAVDKNTFNGTAVDGRKSLSVKMDADCVHTDKSDASIIQSSTELDEVVKFRKKMELQGWGYHKDGKFRYPDFFSYSESYVDDMPATVEVYSYGPVLLCYWPLIGAWSVDEYPGEGRFVSSTTKIKDVTYKHEGKGVYSGYTENGNIYYMKKKIMEGEFVSHSCVLALVYPKKYDSEIKDLIDIIKNW